MQMPAHTGDALGTARASSIMQVPSNELRKLPPAPAVVRALATPPAAGVARYDVAGMASVGGWNPFVGERAHLVRLFLRRNSAVPVPFHERALCNATVSSIASTIDGTTVVDLGCGPGHYTRALRNAGAFVIPIDLDRSS